MNLLCQICQGNKGFSHGVVICVVLLIFTGRLSTQIFQGIDRIHPPTISKWMGNPYSHIKSKGKYFTCDKTINQGINYVSDEGLSNYINEFENESKKLKISLLEGIQL